MTTTDRLTACLVLSGAGHVVHNVAEFGIGAAAASATLVPLAVTGALTSVVRRKLSKRLLLTVGAWGLVVLVAGGGSVLPLTVLPFEPDQSTAHYVTHGIYALLQLPLLATVATTLQSPGRAPRV